MSMTKKKPSIDFRKSIISKGRRNRELLERTRKRRDWDRITYKRYY